MTREEAIRRIKAWKLDSDHREVLAVIIPELAESEDERIRKWLIEEIKATHDYDSPTSKKCVDDALAYLEKQKPAELSEEDDMLMDELESYILYDKEFNDEQKSWRIKRLKSLRPSWKPSEQEKSALRTAICVLTEERNFPKTAEQLQAILDAFDGEESRKQSRKEWKPSEEQMEALKFLVKYVSPSEKYIVIIKNLYDDLRKLM